jgi:predicted SnoaL-like aldol condensation-catalyzing enzyme
MANEDAENKAAEAAITWLALIDEERYNESWDAAAYYFRNAIEKEQWEQSLNAVRKPLGTVVSREIASRTYTKALPGAPDGEYVVIQFTTTFENKKSGVETATPMLDNDGQWRVSEYFIK